MNKPPKLRVILSLQPHLLGAALAAWLSRKPGLDVFLDSGDETRAARSSDVVVSSRPLGSAGTVFVLDEKTASISIFREGTVELHRYFGLEGLWALIEGQRGPPPDAVPTMGRCG